MKIAIMQPYFFPYIGYFQLMNAVDEFVIYDNIEFTKKGWINRNRMLINGKDEYFTLPLKKDSDFLCVYDRFLANTWTEDRKKMLNKIKEAYRKSPFFNVAFPLIEKCILYEQTNLFGFILHSISAVTEYLNINTKLVVSSTINIDHTLKSQEKVISICKNRNATAYFNPIGGVGLYDRESFRNHNLELFFLRTQSLHYKQFSNEFIPFLSILDVLMFNSKEAVMEMLSLYTKE